MQNKATEYVRKQLDLKDDEELGLHHWLRVLQENGGGTVAFSKNGMCIVEGKGIPFAIDLTTGQPATEEDYKAFCEIVGV